MAFSIWSYSPTAGDNTSGNTGVNNDEGWSPKVVNNAARDDKAYLAKYLNDIGCSLEATFGAGVYTLTDAGSNTNFASGDLASGLIVGMTVPSGGANTGACNLNAFGTGSKDIKKQTPAGLVELDAGDLFVGAKVQMLYDGTQYIVLNQVGTNPYEDFYFVATASQTAFTGSDRDGNTLAMPNTARVDVELDGIDLDPEDYDGTAITTTTLTLDVGASEDSILFVRAWK